MTVERLAQWIRSHNVPAIVEGGKVRVGIAWWNPATKAEGIEWFVVGTLAEARDVLGY